MADLEGIIGGAVEAASDLGTPSEDAAPETVETETEVEAAPEAEGEEAPATEGEPTEETPTEGEPTELSEAELAGPALPLSRHKAVLTNERKKREAVEQELATYKSQDTQDKLKAIEIADQNPALFAELLLQDPRFAAEFTRLMGGQQAPQQEASAAKAAPAANVAEPPQPDVLLPDGSVGYSAEASEKLAAYHAQQAEQRMQAILDERFGKFEPIQRNYEAQVAYNRSYQEKVVLLQNARANWPKFTEFEKQIQQYLMDPSNSRATLDEAYRAVVVPSMQTDRDKIRQEVLAELKKKPAASNSGPKPVTAKPAEGGKRSLEDVIRGAVETL
jgi:hypothetical protein